MVKNTSIPAQESHKKNIGVILLAAGASSRLGHPKQLLPYANQSLLEHSLQEAVASGAAPIILVLGAKADSIETQIEKGDACIVVNTKWQEGMASSIRFGVDTLLTVTPDPDGAVLMVCDQPYVSSALLEQLMETYQQTGKRIVASGYDNAAGPPVFFHRTLFPELLQLTGDVGAKKLLNKYPGEVEIVLFPEGNIDIDTEADYRNLEK
ncbi:MAG: nucleotidyltransferase family protein [Bacteroidota bacterium]